MTIDINEICAIHVELTNKCNARCPRCARTLLGKTHPYIQQNLLEWPMQDITSMFPKHFVKGKTFTLGGVVDEPMMHSKIYEIVEYLVENQAMVEIFTNTGCSTPQTFHKLGKLSKNTNLLKMFFSVDGLEHTNHLYRVNVKWNKVLKNMTAYAQQGGLCEWQYLVFKHNEHDIENAKKLALSLKIPFVIRQNMRNTEPYNAHVYKKINGELVMSSYLIEPTYNKKYEHKDIEKKRNNQLLESHDDYKEIDCVMLHKKEIFIDWNKKLWPCCWFATANSFGRMIESNKIFAQFEKDFGIDWNDLNKHSLNEVLQHPYYTKILEKSWKIDHEYHTPICFENCGNSGIRQRYKFTK